MAVQLELKNSTVEDRRPTAAQLANGEISLNYNESGPFLCCKDTAGNVQQLGGVKFAADAPGDPVTGTWWYNTATSKLYVFDDPQWKLVGDGSGGGGGITAIVGGDGIDAYVTGSTVVVEATIDTNKGLFFDSDIIAINAGANISFDVDGKLQADLDGLAYKGTIDLTSDPVPPLASAGDAYANTGSGAMTAAWETATGLGATTVSPGDLVIETASAWTYVPTGGVAVQTDLGLDNRGATTLDITSSTGTDVTVPAATDLLAGLMTGPDKASLDDLVAGGSSQWNRDVDTLKPKVDGDNVDVTDAFGNSVIELNSDGTIQAVEATFSDDVNAVNGVFSGDVGAATGTFTGNIEAVDGIFTGNIDAVDGTFTGDIEAVEGTFSDDVNATNAELTQDLRLAGDIINTVTDGDQDIICDGSGLVELTEYNLTPMEVVTKHDIGTAANEVPLNGFLGTLAYKNDLAIQDGLTVAALPVAPQARVGNIARVTDGAAALAWGDTVTGGGAAQYLVWFNGTNWTVFGK